LIQPRPVSSEGLSEGKDMLRTDFSDSGRTSFLASDDVGNLITVLENNGLGGHWLNENV